MGGAVAGESVLQRFDSVRDEIVRLESSEAELQEKVRQLEADLQVYKRIFSDTNAEKKRLEEENEQLKQNSEKQKEILEKQTLASRVIVLLDGDGAIFSPHLIGLGQNGGHRAAGQLSESIKDRIHALNENLHYQLAVYIFFNKRGLLETLHRCGCHSTKLGLDDFVTGFNQASERFVMVDVGFGKEAADSKIKAFLEDEIRQPQTYQIFFGGCHDNGYVTAIRSHITSGFKHKLILLQSYTEHAAGFDGLELPVLTIPGLFISQKLVSTPCQDPPAASRSLSPPFFDAPIQDFPSFGSGRGDVGEGSEFGGQATTSYYPSPAIYQHILLNQTGRFPVFGSEVASDHSNTEDHGYLGTNKGVPRLLDPTVPLNKQKPPPCTMYYLKNGCKHGAGCKYGHDYVLERQHYIEIKASAKKKPCPAVNRNQNCAWGDSCCYGHVCPSGTKCIHLKKGKCRFVGAVMHDVKE